MHTCTTATPTPSQHTSSGAEQSGSTNAFRPLLGARDRQRMLQLGQKAPKGTGSKPPGAARVRIISLKAFPNQAEFPAGWALVEATQYAARQSRFKNRPFWYGRENEAAQFMPFLSSAECRVRGGQPQSHLLHKTCVAFEPPGRLFYTSRVLRSFDQAPRSPLDDRWHCALSTDFPPCYTFETSSQGTSFSCIRESSA